MIFASNIENENKDWLRFAYVFILLHCIILTCEI